MDTNKATEMFEEKCGTLEEYEGDKEAWRQDLGLFFIGWLASEKAAEQKMHPTAFLAWVIVFVLGFMLGAEYVLYRLGGG